MVFIINKKHRSFVQYHINTIINKAKYSFVQIMHIHVLHLCVTMRLYLDTSVCVYYFDILCLEVTVSVFTHFCPHCLFLALL